MIKAVIKDVLRPFYIAALTARKHGVAGAMFYLEQRLRGSGVSPGVIVHGRHWPRLRSRGRCQIGYAQFTGHIRPSMIDVERGAELVVGDGCYFNEGLSIQAAVSIKIGTHAQIAPDVTIIDSEHQIGEGDPIKHAPIVIGDNVWIATRAIVLAGVTIGDHSVIGAGSVVTKSIPSRVLAAGNPCRVIRPIEASEGWTRF